jgi:hypothetical protein
LKSGCPHIQYFLTDPPHYLIVIVAFLDILLVYTYTHVSSPDISDALLSEHEIVGHDGTKYGFYVMTILIRSEKQSKYFILK